MGEHNKHMHIMKTFECLYTQAIDTISSNVHASLRVSQIKALFAFKDTHCLSMKDLADNAGVKVSNMTPIINRLIQDGMAERGKDEKDRRKVMIRLTLQGENVRSQFLAQQRKVAKSILSLLSEQDKVKLLTSFDTACKILKKIS